MEIDSWKICLNGKDCKFCNYNPVSQTCKLCSKSIMVFSFIIGDSKSTFREFSCHMITCPVCNPNLFGKVFKVISRLNIQSNLCSRCTNKTHDDTGMYFWYDSKLQEIYHFCSQHCASMTYATLKSITSNDTYINYLI